MLCVRSDRIGLALGWIKRKFPKVNFKKLILNLIYRLKFDAFYT